MMPIKVVIADDHALFRDGLRRILSLEKDILVVGEAANGDDVIKVVERTKPDILLLDLKMPKGDVVQNLLEVGAKYPSTRVIILTAFSEEESVLNAAKGGAKGFVPKGVPSTTCFKQSRRYTREPLGRIRRYLHGKLSRRLLTVNRLPVKRRLNSMRVLEALLNERWKYSGWSPKVLPMRRSARKSSSVRRR
jgi:two-component system, NarL family, response regulator DegU